MEYEHILQALAETLKKIEGIQGFHIPVVLKTIGDLEKAGAEEQFIDQQRAQLKKLYDMIAELEEKAARLRKRL